jgi:predicted polyphosphate/ATP-dependent NAD kinase
LSGKVIGFIVNPIAGMGGSVGLKGTDGDAYFEALRRGARPVAPYRALEFLNSINIKDFSIVSAPGVMGADIVKRSAVRELLSAVIGEIGNVTSREDTVRIAKEMSKAVDLLVFVGGDGTARDVYEAVGQSVPVIGVPSGVKVYSAVFAVNPFSAAKLLERFLRGETKLVEREVVDANEDAIRRDKIEIRVYGYMLVPVYEGLLQESKTLYTSADEEGPKLAIAKYVVENMEPGVPYILGPGTTVKAICNLLNLPCTLLGVDVILNGQLLVKDAWEKSLLEVLEKYKKAKIVVTPIGKQGFIFGRGNQQISPRIIRLVGRDNILVIATRSKIEELEYLLVDTGDRDVDDYLSGYIRVLVDYNTYVVKRVVSQPID